MSGDEAGGFVASLATTLLALGAVLAIAWLTLRLWARLTGGRGVGGARKGDGTKRVRIVQSVPVGARERLVVARHGGSEYLLGMSAGGISVIARESLPAEDDAAAPARDG